MAPPSLVIWLRSNAPFVIASTFRTSNNPDYTTYRARAARSSFHEMVRLLERVGADRTVELCGPCLDFAPAEPYALRFLNTTLRLLQLPESDPRREGGVRAWRALESLFLGRRKGRLARPTVLSPLEATALQDRRAAWMTVLRPVWATLEPSERPRLLKAIDACHRVPAAAAYRHDLKQLLARPALRLSDLANALTAWESDVPVRTIRQAIGRRRTDEAVRLQSAAR